MGFSSGSASFFVFEALGQAPSQEEILAGLERGRVGRIDVALGKDRSQGFARFDRPLSTEFDAESVFVGDLALFSYRVDRLAIPSTTLRLHVQERVSSRLAESGAFRLRREEMEEIRDDVKRELLSRAVPSVSAYEVVWNLDSSRVYLFSSSLQVAEDFRVRFKEFLGLDLRAVSLRSLVEQRASDVLKALRGGK